MGTHFLNSFWDGRLGQLAFEFLSREGREGGEVRGTGIFVEMATPMNQAPFRSDIIGICRPDVA
jgi:hypothetical protein